MVSFTRNHFTRIILLAIRTFKKSKNAMNTYTNIQPHVHARERETETRTERDTYAHKREREREREIE